MNAASSGLLADRLPGLALDAPHNVPQIVDAMLAAAQQAGASDLHLVPGPDQLDLYWRLDGVLKNIDQLPHAIAPNIVARLKVLAELLTYRVEVPQEGRIRTGNARVEMRVSTFPTLYGEKVVIRLFVGSGRYRRLADLGLPADVTAEMKDLLAERGGLLLATGPAGCGKTTTVYAALREFTEGSDGGRSLVSIEDPIEAVIPGVAQSQVQPAAGFTYDIGLRSLLRQDPDVMLVGEIRDRGTAELVFQASLAGHLVLSTYHAGDSIAALQRLEDMGIERYQLKSGLLGIVSQRLMRRLCECAVTRSQPEERLGLPVADVRVPGGCDRCQHTGYAGRLVAAELLSRAGIGRVCGEEWDPAALQVTLVSRGLEAVRTGATSPAEFRRVFGLKAGQ